MATVLAGRRSRHSTWLLVTEGLQTLVTWLPSFFCKQSRNLPPRQLPTSV